MATLRPPAWFLLTAVAAVGGLAAPAEPASLAAAEVPPCAEAAGGDEEGAVCESFLSLRQLRAGRRLATETTADRGGGSGDDERRRGGSGDDERRRARLLAALQRRAGQSGTARSLAESLAEKTQTFYLYHQTSIPICHRILAEGFRPGRVGWCGGAIYFSDSVAGTYGEAVGVDSHQGCVLRALVDMGNIKTMGKTCDYSMDGARLKSMGYDSIRFNDGAGTGWQYVIFDPSRVKSVQILKEDPTWKGPPQMQNPNP